MSMIEVDPFLFAKCRLCVDELGHYQIVPIVQQHIKYCFDIEIEPYDGLPQLICKKCESVLKNFHTVKTTFLNKQASLKTMKKNTTFNKEQNQNQENLESIEEQNQNQENLESIENVQHHHQEPVSSSQNDIDSGCVSEKGDISKEQKEDISKEQPPHKKMHLEDSVLNIVPWEPNYAKKIICRVCNQKFQAYCDMKKHLKLHDNILKKFRNILKPCSVQLVKVDGKTNIFNIPESVCFSPRNILHNERHLYSHIVYYKKEASEEQSDSVGSELGPDFKDSSSSEDIPVKRKAGRLRILSRSSSDTVVIDNKINPSVKSEKNLNNDNIDLISIYDSSSDNSSLNVNVSKVQNILQQADEIVQEIASICVNKYQKKLDDPNETHTNKNTVKNQKTNETHLKHKVLSLGRKVINKQGFACMGLLRYLEYKNLDIIYKEASSDNFSKETEYVRIMTKLKSNNTKRKNSQSWRKVEGSVNISNSSVDCDKMNKTDEPVKKIKKAQNNSPHCQVTTKIKQSKLLNISPVANPKRPKSMKACEVNEPSNSLSIDITNLKDTSRRCAENGSSVIEQKGNVFKNKLNDVNPSSNSSSLDTLTQNKVNNVPCVDTSVPSEQQENTCNNSSMPIITPQSIAPVTAEEFNKGSNQLTCHLSNQSSNFTEIDSAKSMPRIKVKPFSELMPQKVKQNNNQQQAINEHAWCISSNNLVPIYNNISAVDHAQPSFSTFDNQNSACVNRELVAPEYVVLNTDEFPNHKTNNPIQYFRNLLQIHGIILLDPSVPIPLAGFICLLKYKVLFTQEPRVEEPVSLGLSLFCKNNIFSLEVIDPVTLKLIDIREINAIWHWEILKTYRGEAVITKLLARAQEISREVHDYTNTFLSILKRIEMSM